MEHDPLRRGVAEFIGTFVLIFVGMGSIAFIQSNLLVGVALAHGLAIAIMASAVGHISGGHFNPAVTLGFLVTRRIVPSLALVYWLAQLAGAVLGALALRALFPSEANLDSGVPVVNATINAGQGVAIEALLTFFLVWVIFATAVDPGGAFKSIAGLAIGLTITIGVLGTGPLTGAAMNPARALGPEIVFDIWDDWWVYLRRAVARRGRRRARLRLALPARRPAAARRHARLGPRRAATGRDRRLLAAARSIC